MNQTGYNQDTTISLPEIEGATRKNVFELKQSYRRVTEILVSKDHRLYDPHLLLGATSNST